MSELVDGAGAVAEINYAHDAMINMVLANRGVHQNQIAEELGYSPAWVSVVMSTPIFQEKLARRAAQLEDPILKEKIRVLMQTTMHRSLEVLSKKMEADALEIPDNLALRSFEVTSRALGYGARVEAPAQNPVSVNIHLDSLKENLVGLLRRERKALENESTLQSEGVSR